MPPVVPKTLHEAFIDKWFARDPVTQETVADPVLAGLRDGMAAARKLAEQLAATAEAILADPTSTAGGNAAKVRDAALKLAERATKGLDGARSRALAEMQRLDTATFAPPPPKDAVALQIEGEIRAALRQMTPEQRRDSLAAAIKTGDEATVGAFLRGPVMLTGASDSEREARRHEWRAKKYPAETDRLARLKSAIEATDRGGTALLAYVEAVASDPRATFADAAAQRAREAIAAISQKETTP